MDSTVIVALAGFATTAATAGVVPVLLARRTERAAAAGRLHERQLADQANIRERQMAAYVAASAYVHAVQDRLDDLTTPIHARSGRPLPATPNTALVTSELRLLAPWPLFESWQTLMNAYNLMSFVLGEEGPTGEHGEFHIDEDASEAVRVQQAIDSVTRQLRSAVGADPPGGE
ncbi:hypothetical protein ACQEVZ_54890 [Dactylosporangium sp. CA-152071]|uniref:hypothetical protein n=1 Tax=Dactylosporangium sp. CA-152071 TaxID=3239933 RepID=UPI003D9124AD